MPRRFIDVPVFSARNMAKEGNIDFRYWFDKTNEERLSAATCMIEIAFQEPLLLRKNVTEKFFLRAGINYKICR
jgi:hypothetical protein